MRLAEVRSSLLAGDALVEILERIGRSEDVAVSGLAGSLPAVLVSLLPKSTSAPLLVVAPSEEDAAYLRSDLLQFLDAAPLYPSSDLRPDDPDHLPDAGRIVARSEVLDALQIGAVDLVVTSADAFREPVPARSAVADSTVRVEKGATIGPDQLAERLVELGFGFVDFAEEPGDLAVRGGIVDVYPFAGGYPVRIEFFGDEVESIREFDPTSQRSVSEKVSVRLFPNLESSERPTDDLEPLVSHFPEDTRVVLVGPLDDDVVRATQGRQRISVGRTEHVEGGHAIEVRSSPQPDFNGHLNLLRELLARPGEQEWTTIILCDSKSQRLRLEELLETELAGGKVFLELASLHEGFELSDPKIRVYTDHQIFKRYHRPSTRKATHAKAGLSLREIRSLRPGDFIVHADYGIGRFEGMRKIDVRGRTQEAVCVKYRDDDTLFVNVAALHKLHKYKGKDGATPTLTKLGSGQWERTTARTKKRVKDIARDLIKLYAQRHATSGFAFSEDTLWQRELEASFEFEDTPDQQEAAAAVKEDMSKPAPMDRLVCGDVGFGKTEIAVRAAFKAVQDAKQVAVLVPTTVLAAQHLETFSQRLADYPVKVAMISRFVPVADQKKTLEDVASGKVDILIGTHRIVSKDVQFKDLGLMIIDEEQRFGVAVKEKLRKMRVNVDTLTLTATPIPRTLQFSLLGARDLSIVGTPPPNRQPIVTEIHAYSTDLIRDAIRYELSRGGQVFFIHNRVQTIEEMSAALRVLVPDARLQVAHGQMNAARLEHVMEGFKNHDFDVLVSTNIIENGLDISNANTIIINHANRFGLSELHQIRGRVGRSDRKAFCYLLVPSIQGLTREARQRLTAIEEFSDLGSGFNLAMRDLDIRGAGNMLGAEQSGFIADVGFETYHRILDDAVRELRTEEFPELFAQQPPAPPSVETTVELDADALLPADYMRQETERLNVYKRISEADSSAVLDEIRNELSDRFGPPPAAVENLLTAARIRLMGGRMGFAKVVYKNNRVFLTCPTPEEYPGFYDNVFREVLERLTALDNRYVLKETKSKKVQAIVQDVPTLADAEAIIAELGATTTTPTRTEPASHAVP